MATTITVICYKSKILKNNESPLMLRVTKDRKRKYVSLGISLDPSYWDFSKQQPKPDCPNREYIEMIIADKTKEYSAKIIELKSKNQEFTATTLVEKVNVNTRVGHKTVGDVFLDFIDRLKTENRKGYALSVRQVYNSLIEFNTHLDIPFCDLNITWLKRFEIFLREKGLAENTIGIRFRTLRAVYNIAIEEGIASQANYPFAKFKVSKIHQETAKRALTKEDIECIINFKSTDRYIRFPIDIFAFTYYCGGINFVDIAYLKIENIIDGKLIYQRRKTKKLIKIPLKAQALDIIYRYHKEASPYLFPILSSFHNTDTKRANRIHKVITKVNSRLKKLGEELGLSIPLTTYVARHSQATIMKRAGISTSVISEIMGHSSERVTRIYLDRFDNEQITDALKTL